MVQNERRSQMPQNLMIISLRKLMQAKRKKPTTVYVTKFNSREYLKKKVNF